MSDWPILSVLTFLPLVGVVLILLRNKGGLETEKTILWTRWIALLTSLATFCVAIAAFAAFSPGGSSFQLQEKADWIPSLGIVYRRGVDGISIWFVMLSAFLTPICVLAGWTIKKRVRDFMIAFLVLETMMLGTFTALDIILFYVFFEGVLIPMFLIIGVWGGEGRVYASFKFFLYTLSGSVLMLIAIIAMALKVGTTDMTMMMGGLAFPQSMALVLWLAFFASFAVKTPMWPFHTWLPYAHVEAPTAGSVILAGVLLKMGGYGMIRIMVQILPQASAEFAAMMMVMSVIAIVYASLVALVQTDLKKLVAYSSVAHMGYVTLGIFVGNRQGLEGAMMVMLSHGLVSAALFLCVGVVYDRLHTRAIDRFGGVASVMPRYAALFMFFTLASIGLPGLSGFVGEVLALQGAFQTHGGVAAFAALGMVLGAAYMLWVYRRVFFGVADKDDVKAMPDLSLREWAMFVPLVILVVWMGVYPATFQNLMGATLDTTLRTNSVLTSWGTP